MSGGGASSGGAWGGYGSQPVSNPSFVESPALISVKVALLQSQTVGQDLDNRLAKSLADTAEIAAYKEALTHKWDSAAASYRRIYYLTGEINKQTTHATIDTLSRWDDMDREDPQKMFTIIVCSPGGDVVTGFQLYSFLKGLSMRRPLRIAAAGICASMATVIHQAASEGERTIEPGCTYLLHQVSGVSAGRFDEISDTTKWLHQLNCTMREIFADRGKLEPDVIQSKIERRELFLTPEEVVDEWGLADRICHVP